jgi:hypothetical protein
MVSIDPKPQRGNRNKGRNGEAGNQPNPNRDKWKDVASDLVPPSIPVWVEALQSVDKDWSRIRRDLPQSQRGYMFPDPNSLASLSPTQQAKKIANWLSIRAGSYTRCFYHAGILPPLAPAATWRTLLNTDASTILSEPVLNAKGKETKASQVRRAAKEIFGEELVAQLKGGIEELWWHETALQVNQQSIVDLDANIVREVIWELFEHSFRYEFLLLDMVAARSLWHDPEDHVGRPYAAAARQDTIREVFGNDGKFLLWGDPFPTRNSGFQAETMDMRTPSLERLRKVMVAWPSVPSVLDHSFYPELGKDRYSPVVLERRVVGFYCQTFFDYFGRPPIVPHRIPIHADTRCSPSLGTSVAPSCSNSLSD